MADKAVTCYRPLTAWFSKEVNPSGKRSMVFDASKAANRDEEIKLPCGQCIGCKLERSRQWAIRCVHEASLHEQNCFITLTFDENSLAARERPKSLDKREFQLFMKRLRKEFSDRKIRFFHCGEYGDKNGRPHYHAILFGIDFEDKELMNLDREHPLYRSKTLERLWPFGFSTIGEMTFESAAYVARYCLKKITGDIALTHYAEIDYDSGEILYDRDPEYTTMSRGRRCKDHPKDKYPEFVIDCPNCDGGIATRWYEQFKSDCYPKDWISLNGKKMKPPKFYEKKLEQDDFYLFSDIKDARKLASREIELPQRDRLDEMETSKRLRIQRTLERKL